LLISILAESLGEVESRRKFFLDFAASNGFNPYMPSSWYSVTSSQILAVKVEKGEKKEKTRERRNGVCADGRQRGEEGAKN
jgi:hypothetical protein